MKKFSWVLFLFGFFFLMIAGCGYIMGQAMDPQSKQLSHVPYLALVKIEGTLMDPLPVMDQIRKHVKDKNCRGMMIRVDSPGGAVGAAQEINQELLSLRESDFPVVASFGNISASGGVYATASAKQIFANAGTLTGSIGVITQFPEATKLMEKVGVKMNVITSGKYKATGNPFIKLNDGSKSRMQAVINDTWMQFVEAISIGRGLSMDSVRSFSDGSIFTGRQAQELGLVDSLGGFESARDWLTDATGMPSGTELIELLPPKPFIDRILKEPMAEVFKALQTHSSELPMFLLP